MIHVVSEKQQQHQHVSRHLSVYTVWFGSGQCYLILGYFIQEMHRTELSIGDNLNM